MIEPKITPYAYKCVLIVDNTLPTGIIANISAVLSMALGKTNPEIIGKDVKDASGIIHAGITQLPIPILGASKTELRHIRERIKDMNEIENSIVDFTTWRSHASHTKNTRNASRKLLKMNWNTSA